MYMYSPLKVIFRIITTYDANHMTMTVMLMVMKASVMLDHHSMYKVTMTMTAKLMKK